MRLNPPAFTAIDGPMLTLPHAVISEARLSFALALGALGVLGGLAPAIGLAQLTDDQRIRVAEQLKASTVTVAAGPSTGSGFIAPVRGLIVTNAHVASGARRSGRMRVRFGDGSMQEARLLAYDARHDLAIAQVLGSPKLKPLPLGDSDAVKVGQTVLAFGSPFGLDGTLTQGIVSARRDDLQVIGSGDLRGVIQTDAPINPGNSGGPLVNTRGEVVGVNTAIVSRSGASNGIGFAVPVSYVKALLAEVDKALDARASGPAATHPMGAPSLQGRSGKRPPVWLGVLGSDFRARGYRGVRVDQVAPGSPAAEAGLLGAADPPPPFILQLGIPWTGHIILAVDSVPVRSMADLQKLLARHAPGEQALITITVGPGILTGETVVDLLPPPKGLRL
jgi:S1-C subfamily serine protease